MSGDPRVMARDLSAGYGGAPVLSGVTFAAEAGRSVCVLGPNGGGKTTLFRVLLGEIDPDGRRAPGGGPAGLHGATERTRLDFPVNAADVALMGTLAAGRWWLPPRRASADAARAALERVGLDGREHVRSASSPAASASARCWPGRWSRTRPCCSSTSRSQAWIPPARR